uniref:Uncharacterized protein n=1 Tax=Piliocolobus tephrosceles TaxID=591936 RepID=A0A8C9GTF0_9PRIM
MRGRRSSPVETGSRGALRLQGGAPGSAAGFQASIWGAAQVPFTCRAPAPGLPPPPHSRPRCLEPDALYGWGSVRNAGYRGPDRACPAQDGEGRSSSPAPPPRLKAMTSQARKQNGGVGIPEMVMDWTRESQKPQPTVGQEGSASRQASWVQPDMSFSVLLSIFLCLHISGVALGNSTLLGFGFV